MAAERFTLALIDPVYALAVLGVRGARLRAAPA